MDVKKSEISELEALASVYGYHSTLNDIITRLKSRTPYRCPQCKGVGYTTRCIPGEWGYTEDRFVDETCSLCNGVGYTEKEYVPRMVQNGWVEK